MKKILIKILKVAGIAAGVLAAVVIGYFIYVFCAYYRIEDNLALEVKGIAKSVAPADGEFTIATNNIGYGSLHKDYTFFMDGGEYSVAFSEDSVKDCVNNSADILKKLDADFYLIQEVDTDSTRSYHIDEYEMITNSLSGYCTDFAYNYDSPFLFYPITEPHGKSVAGIATYSKYLINDALRVSLPITDSLKKLIDLDRCLSVSRISVDNGKELVLINLHLSAYTGEGSTVRTEQVTLLSNLIKAEYDKGNYVICGGDFNHYLPDVKNPFAESNEGYEWSADFPREMLPAEFSVVSAVNCPSCRNLDKVMGDPDLFFTVIDGFIVSDNIQVEEIKNIDTRFEYSDHNPVFMKFRFK